VTHKLIRTILFSASVSVLSMFTAAALPTTCSSLDGDTLAQLEGIGSCTYGGFTFSDFNYTNSNSGGGQQVMASDIKVDAVTNSDGAGLSFDASWDATLPGSTSDGNISFVVTANNGATAINDAGLAQTDFVYGNGFASVGEQGCSGTGCVPGTWSVDVFQAGGGTDASSNTTIFTPTGAVTVSKDINADANNGAASISLVTDVFSVPAVPEPRGVALLLGLGLVAGFAFRKKLQGANS
jgi:hypothetical protein